MNDQVPTVDITYSPSKDQFHFRYLSQPMEPNPHGFISFARCFLDEARSFTKYVEKNKKEFLEIKPHFIEYGKYFMKWFNSKHNPYNNK